MNTKYEKKKYVYLENVERRKISRPRWTEAKRGQRSLHIDYFDIPLC